VAIKTTHNTKSKDYCLCYSTKISFKLCFCWFDDWTYPSHQGAFHLHWTTFCSIKTSEFKKRFSFSKWDDTFGFLSEKRSQQVEVDRVNSSTTTQLFKRRFSNDRRDNERKERKKERKKESFQRLFYFLFLQTDFSLFSFSPKNGFSF
jgi:hypothetical protein